MRKRKDIEKDIETKRTERELQKIKIELALDIRDILDRLRKDFKKIFHR